MGLWFVGMLRCYFLAMVMLLVGSLVHWLWVLGFTLDICRNIVLKGRDSIALDSEVLSIVQPNLRYTCRPSGALGDLGCWYSIHMSPRWGFASASTQVSIYRTYANLAHS